MITIEEFFNLCKQEYKYIKALKRNQSYDVETKIVLIQRATLQKELNLIQKKIQQFLSHKPTSLPIGKQMLFSKPLDDYM